jgi:hypothetical protein
LSHTFKSSHVADPQLAEMFARLELALNAAQPSFTFSVLHAAPTKTWAGMVIVVDGVDFNPGSGEGMYRRDKTNAAWVFIG